MFRRRNPNIVIPGRAGNAGIIASFAIAFVGILIGATTAYISERGVGATAAKSEMISVKLRDGDDPFEAYAKRQDVIHRVLTATELERLPVPEFTARGASRPKIILVIDDMGIDRRAVSSVINLPGPVTLSFLPYANDVAELATTARDAGVELMLHLPMEPQGEDDPGPHALKSGMTGADFIKTLEWNLAQFEGFVGVNNHMGSQLTADEAAMKTVLAYLKHKDLFFMDSVTTGDTIVRRAGARVGANVFSRDVFIDAEAGNRQMVKSQLALVERIARQTGYAVAIGHPRKETLEVLGPWLTTAPARGFDLVPASALLTIEKSKTAPTMVAAPSLRL